MKNNIEIWKPINEYEGRYEVSNLGEVKSIERKDHTGRRIRERILKKSITKGYFYVKLCKMGTQKSFTVHNLVAQSFLNHNPCGHKIVVDHINNIKKDNRLVNLQLITQRENASKDRAGGTSNFIGVSWDTYYKKWASRITIDNKNINLGYFKCELAAAKSYQNKLKEITNG